MKTNNQKGFTLIELLVVIAIIGILASVIIASLSSARKKGDDAAVEETLRSAHNQAELFYSTSNSYQVTKGSSTDLCATAADGLNPKGINSMILTAGKAYSSSIVSVTVTGASTSTNAVCAATANGWAASAPLSNPKTAGDVWCVDYTGFSGEVAPGTISADGDINC